MFAPTVGIRKLSTMPAERTPRCASGGCSCSGVWTGKPAPRASPTSTARCATRPVRPDALGADCPLDRSRLFSGRAPLRIRRSGCSGWQVGSRFRCRYASRPVCARGGMTSVQKKHNKKSARVPERPRHSLTPTPQRRMALQPSARRQRAQSRNAAMQPHAAQRRGARGIIIIRNIPTIKYKCIAAHRNAPRCSNDFLAQVPPTSRAVPQYPWAPAQCRRCRRRLRR